MKRSILIILFILSTVLISCSEKSSKTGQTDEKKQKPAESITLAATIPPVAMILKELAAERATVDRLLPAGVSPVLFEPKPSVVKRLNRAEALFYVDHHLDSWALKFRDSNRHSLFEMLPADRVRKMPHLKEHSEDPHFWADPLTVKAVLPELTDRLCAIDRGGCSIYRRNSAQYKEKLTRLHEQISELLKDFRGRKVVLYHPSFYYFTERYHLEVLFTIEPAPGKKPSPRALTRMAEQMKAEGVKAVFSEPQLNARAAEVIAAAADGEVYLSDPLGGTEERDSLSELLLYNAKTMRKALLNK